MLDNLQTLITLSKVGTMMETSTQLKISQSAVSKRIGALERFYDRKLVERQGRRVVLTPHGTRLVEKVTPLIYELRSVFLEDKTLRRGKIVMGVSEAILASWGPNLIAAVQREMPEVEFSCHAQRSPIVLDRIRSGEYMVGLCTGSSNAESDLQSELIRLEPMVILPSSLDPITYTIGEPLDVITIESRSGAWGSIEEDMRRLNLRRSISLESFFSTAQMGLAGFGHALVPQGVARTLGVKPEQMIALGESGLNRPVRFVARKSMFSRSLIQTFFEVLMRQIEFV